jgi:hypothetical protein
MKLSVLQWSKSFAGCDELLSSVGARTALSASCLSRPCIHGKRDPMLKGSYLFLLAEISED